MATVLPTVQAVPVNTGNDKGAARAAPAVAEAMIVSVGAGQKVVDAMAFNNLANVRNLEIQQGKWLMEAATCGCVPNSYTIKDKDTNTAIFMLEEESSCCCRCCCQPHHPLLVKYYNVLPPAWVPEKKCCGQTCVPAYWKYEPDRAKGAVMTFERLGLCQKFSNCFVCCKCCQEETFLHAGDTPAGAKPGEIDDSKVMASTIVPIGGGGCHPTVHLMDRMALGDKDGTHFATIKGPMCFGGCKDLWCETPFSVSTPDAAGSANLAQLIKRRPKTCKELCMRVCSPADIYDLSFTADDSQLTPQQKALIMSEVVHLDYMFFEADKGLCWYEERGPQQKQCVILCCLCYCYGCLCPCKCIIPLNDNGGG